MREFIKNADIIKPTVVFVALVFLTILTVALAELDDSDTVALLIALSIATLKGSLVLYFFMHLNHEPLIFKVFLAIAFFTLVVIFVLTFSDYAFRGGGMSNNASVFSHDVNFAFWFIFSLSAFFLVGITGFIIYSIIRYNRKNNPEPTHIEGHTGLEIVWTIVPTILVLFIFYFGMQGFLKMRNVPDNAMEIKVDAGKWWWKFTYPDGLEQTTEQGLTVPVDTPIYLPLHSVDVIHSFYVPAFRVKMDVVPKAPGDDLNYTWFEAQSVGSYDLFCAEYCGLNHSQMLSKVHVLSKEDYETWYATTSAAHAKLKAESPGKALLTSKGCVACHSVDGSRLVGPSLKGLFGKREIVLRGGVETEIIVDETYLKHSLQNPADDIVMGYQPLMPPLPLTDEEIGQLIDHIKELSE